MTGVAFAFARVLCCHIYNPCSFYHLSIGLSEVSWLAHSSWALTNHAVIRRSELKTHSEVMNYIIQQHPKSRMVKPDRWVMCFAQNESLSYEWHSRIAKKQNRKTPCTFYMFRSKWVSESWMTFGQQQPKRRTVKLTGFDRKESPSHEWHLTTAKNAEP